MGFWIVLALIFLGVFVFLGKSTAFQAGVKSALPASVSSVAVTAAVDAANVANNAAVDAVKLLNLDAARQVVSQRYRQGGTQDPGGRKRNLSSS